MDIRKALVLGEKKDVLTKLEAKEDNANYNERFKGSTKYMYF